MIVSVTLGRVYNLGNYENLRLEATASVQDGNVSAAFDEARAAVEAEYARQRQPAPQQRLSEPPATAKQLSYIGRLQDDLAWSSEQLSVYADEQGVDLTRMTMHQASTFINGMKRLAERRNDGPANQDIPF